MGGLDPSVPWRLLFGICHLDWVLSYMGWLFGICHLDWGLSNMGGFCHGVCRIWVGSLGFVTLFGVCQIWAGFVTGFVVIFMRHRWAIQRVLPRPFCAVPSFIWDLSLLLRFVKYGWVLSNMGPKKTNLVFVMYGWGLSHMG